MHFLSHSLFLKKLQGNVFLPRKEVSQLKMKLSRLHPHMFLLVQPKHLRSQLPEAPGGKWSFATPSRAVPHSPTLTHPAGTLCASPAMAGWGHKVPGQADNPPRGWEVKNWPDPRLSCFSCKCVMVCSTAQKSQHT